MALVWEDFLSFQTLNRSGVATLSCCQLCVLAKMQTWTHSALLHCVTASPWLPGQLGATGLYQKQQTFLVRHRQEIKAWW